MTIKSSSAAEFNNGDFFAQRIDPNSFTWRDAVEIGEAVCRAFEQEPLFWWWWGPHYQFNNDHEYIRQNIKDPRQRLDEFINRANAYRRLIRTWARDRHDKILARESLFQGLYTKDGEMAGFCSWRLPQHLVPQISQELGKTGFQFWLKRTWIRFKYWIQEIIDFWGYPHPLANPRINEYYDTVEEEPSFKEIEPPSCPETYRKLVQKTRDELFDEGYPEKDTVHLSFFLILPEHQRKGLGSKLLNWAMDDIPIVDTPFTYEGKTVYGPQKLSLKSSDEGQRLYRKCGFKDLHYYVDLRDGRDTVNVTMAKTRSL